MVSREERIFSELLLARGLVARDFIEGCESQRSSGAAGPSLAEVLIDSGGLAREQAEEVLEEARAIDATLAPHLSSGATLGEFRLVREIGRGGMGIVYEAEQPSLGRSVALKVLPAGAALDERLAVRFLREARAAAKLQHPGIVPVFGSGRAEGVLFFAMELVRGHSLADLVRDGPVSAEAAARAAAEIARALEHAHAAGLIHRDVKPENVLLGADGRARLTDFGLVHESVSSSFTLPHHVLGTPAFMAPEQALGKPVDRRSDIYSLGAVLYTLLSGRAPYEGELPSIVLSRILAGSPLPLRSLRAGIPPGLAAICDRAMARRPEDRYDTAAEMAEDLEAFGRGETPAAVDAARRNTRVRGAKWLAAGAGLLLLVSAGVWISALELRPLRATEPAAVADSGGGTIRTLFSSDPPPAASGFESDPFQSEAGVKFRSDTCGFVTAIRFYKDKQSAGSHVGHLWTAAGALLATAVFSGETSEGWQEASLTSPVRIAPDTTYVASYTIGAGMGYVRHVAGFEQSGVDRPPLHALKGGAGGCNGVFKYGPPRDAGGFPDQCESSTNYLVDIAFREVACARDADPTFVLVNASLGHKRWPTFSPDGKTLAYASCSESGCDSWLQDLSTSEIVKLAPVRSAPSFSPDGKSLAFAGEGGVDVLALDGRTLDERTIRHFPAPVHDARVAWSPAGETVVFSEQGLSPGDSSRSGIWEGEPASRRVRLLSDIDARDIAYSPHGSRIACVSRRGGTRDLWTMSSKGAEPVRLTSDADAEWSPFWSPDGTRLYFGSDRGGTPRLWSVRIDESSGRSSGVPTPALNIAFPGTFYATPSADGSRMAIVTEEHPGRIFRLPLDPVSGTLAASPQALPDYPGGLMHPDLSPDQKQLVCLCADQHDLGILTADGSGQPRRLMNDAYQDESPRWSPDGERIAFHSNRSGGVEIWTIRPDGTDLRQITRNTHGGASSPVWSPDGNRLAFHANGGSAFLISARSGDRNSQPEALPSLGSQTFEPWSWSPDGETLAGSADGLGVYLYSIRKRTFRRITDFGGHPIWLPDGRRLVFVGERKIFLIDIAGGEPREIYAAAPAALRPYLTVSADGRSIFTSLNASDGSIWVSPAPN